VAGIKQSEVCVVLPAFNEEKNISRVVGEIRSLGYFVLVVDDGSEDKTALEANKSGAEVLIADRNQGKGAALQRGFRWFLEHDYEALVMMDADGQHDPKEIELFLNALNEENGDFIVGNRMKNPEGMSFIRVLTNRFMSWLISQIARQEIPDSQCGYRAARREVLKSIHLSTNHFEAESEMLLEASRLGFHIGSIPICSVYADETSHIRPIRDTLRFFNFLFRYLIR